MRLETHVGKPIDNPDEGQIARAIANLTSDDAFAILSRDQMHYMQVAGTVADGFTLEYQSGGTDRHFVAGGGPHSEEQVMKAFQLYAVCDPRWQTEFAWEPMAL